MNATAIQGVEVGQLWQDKHDHTRIVRIRSIDVMEGDASTNHRPVRITVFYHRDGTDMNRTLQSTCISAFQWAHRAKRSLYTTPRFRRVETEGASK